MTSGATPDSPAPTAKKPRGHYIAPVMPYPHADVAGTPVWKKLWFWLFALVGLLVAMPALELGWNILRPDTAKPAHAPWPEYRYEEKPAPVATLNAVPVASTHPAGQIGRARVIAGLIAALPADPGIDADVLAGRRFDAEATPRFINSLLKSQFFIRGSAEEVLKASKPPFRPGEIKAYDGFLRAKIAKSRTEHNAIALASASAERLDLSESAIHGAASAEDYDEALAHERDVFSEIRSDAALITSDTGGLKTLIAALARRAAPPPAEFAAASARAFDAALDEKPDATLRAISETPAGDTSGFLRLALSARKPNEHRRRVSGLLKQFGDALAGPNFAEARRSLPPPGEARDIRLATALLRNEVLRRLGGDTALDYFFAGLPAPEPGLEDIALKFFTLSDVKDPYGEALLLHRRASLLALIARRDRTRFEAAATAYALAIEYRRTANGGQRPRDTQNLFAGLTESYPYDPFTGEPLLYSRKKLTLHSPGADGVALGGLDEPEFATNLAQLWEPTVPLESEPPTNPKAFGLKPSDLDKPVIRAAAPNDGVR